MKLKKTLEQKLLGNIYAQYIVGDSGQSNNGAYYVLEKDDKKVHVKIVDLEQEDEEGLNESRLSRLASGSKHISKLIRSGKLSDRYGFLEFEFIAGRNLCMIPQLDDNQLLKLATQITQAISDLWSEGIVHRDIKPGNIMLGDDGDFYLVDLGIGYYMEMPNRDNTKSKGSRYYSSPEQFFASTDPRVEITFASDLYSLAMVLFEKATGNHPRGSWSKKRNCYGESITQDKMQEIELSRPDLDKKLAEFINKNLSIYKPDRFLSPKSAMDFLDNQSQSVKQGKLYVHDHSNDCSYIDPFFDDAITGNPDGVIVPITASDKRIKQLKKKGLEVIIDPLTYRLPHASAKNTTLKSKLKYKVKASFDADRISREREEITAKTLNPQGESEIFILPYFAIEALEDPFLAITKAIWAEGKTEAIKINDSKRVFGGLVIPAFITKHRESTNKLLNLVLSKYGVDGYYLIFESPNTNVSPVDFEDFLNNAKRIIEAFQNMGEVILGHSDMGYWLTSPGVAHSFGWSNAKRRFIYDNVLRGKLTGFRSTDFDPKLFYYIPKLLTLIKGEAELRSIWEFAPEGAIDCSCTNCDELKPYDGNTPKELNLAALHYFQTIVEQHKEWSSNPIEKRIDALNQAADLAASIKELSGGVVGNKIIPNHKAILSVIDN